MKFILRKNTIPTSYTVWSGRKQNYNALIEKPNDEHHPDFKLYLFKIRTPEGLVIHSDELNQKFYSLEECQIFISNWVDESLKISMNQPSPAIR